MKPSKRVRMLRLATLIGLCLSSQDVAAESALQLDQIKKLAKEAIKDDKMVVMRPYMKSQAHSMEFVAAMVVFPQWDGWDSHTIPEEWPLQTQMEIELYRKYVGDENMEQYYADMEGCVKRQLAAISSHTGKPEELDRKLKELHKEAFGIAQQGAQAWARKEGKWYSGGPYSAKAMVQRPLLAPMSAVVDIVPNTVHLILSARGVSVNQYPWRRYRSGQMVKMLGTYYCRVIYPDKVIFQEKYVSSDEDVIDFR